MLTSVRCPRLSGNMLAKLAHIRVLRAPMDGMLVSFGPWSAQGFVPRRYSCEVSVALFAVNGTSVCSNGGGQKKGGEEGASRRGIKRNGKIKGEMFGRSGGKAE